MSMRFLPWARRGLAGVLDAVDDGGELASRASFPVTVRVNGVDASVDVTTYGPGDVTGLDPGAIVRTVPRRHATNVAPDEFAAVEFGAEDLPWMFTPAAAPGDDRLRPWLVLVVVEEVEGVSIRVTKDAPLPVLTIEAPAVPAEQLPDLAESWAWAHVQAMGTDAESTPSILSDAPHRSLARVVCPRRLRPDTRHIAALVPAFDVGVVAGLGGEPGEAPARPAWDLAALGETMVLPVYFHWSFRTGPAGDFESLARRLRPMPLPDGVGRSPMALTDAHPALPPLDPADGGVVDMEGALRAPEVGDGAALDSRHTAWLQGLVDLVEAGAATDAPRGAGTRVPEAVAPPLYGQWFADVHHMPGPTQRPRWLRDVNADPRWRVAAGLGAEVVRANQEEYVDAAWQQVGDVMAANRLLSLARAAAAIAERVHTRHLRPLDDQALLDLAAGAAGRLPVVGRPLVHVLAESATPDGLETRSFRRLGSPRSPVLRAGARRVGMPVEPLAGLDRSALDRAHAGELTPELARSPDGLVSTELVQFADDGQFGRFRAGTDARILKDRLDFALRRMARVDDVVIQVRPDLAGTGLLDDHQLAAIRGASGLRTVMAERVARVREFSGVLGRRTDTSDVVGIHLTVDAVLPLTVNREGEVVVEGTGAVVDRLGTGLLSPGLLREVRDRIRSLPDPGTRIEDVPGGLRRRLEDFSGLRRIDPGGGRIDPRMGRMPPGGIGGRIPPDVLRRIRDRGVIGGIPGVTGGTGGRGGGGGDRPPQPIEAPDGITVDLPLREAGAIGAFALAFKAQREATALAHLQPLPRPPALSVASLRSDLLAQTAPRPVVERRVLSRLKLGGGLLMDAVTDRIGLGQAHPTAPVMVGPVLERPLYLDLARFDQERFLPGGGRVPDDAITLLETNPRFVEAFMLGANHEMNRELLWRRYPGDRRATVFRRFWDHLDGSDDITPIHTWPARSRLGTLSEGDAGGSLVLLIRGQLLRRYPNTVVYAAGSTPDRRIDPAGALHMPVFAGFLEPDLVFVGFDLDVTEALAGDGLLFVLQEQPTEPRFGLDVPGPGDRVGSVPASWSELSWGHLGAEPGDHLRLAALSGAPERPLAADRPGVRARFARDSAHFAAITFQRPFRAAVHADEILE
jgi:hypothetical protein